MTDNRARARGAEETGEHVRHKGIHDDASGSVKALLIRAMAEVDDVTLRR